MKDSGQKQDMQEQKEVQDQIRESGQVIVENGKGKPRIYILSVIGEIEGHENLSGSSKPPNTSTYFRNWRRSRGMTMWMAFSCSSTPWEAT